MTVVVTAVFHPAEGRTAELVDALRATIPAVHEERGCRLSPSTTPTTARSP